MNPNIAIFVVFSYFLLLLIVSLFAGKGATTSTFFYANKRSPWYLVAFGMIGASLSGISFISIPGWVKTSNFSYMATVVGFILGYIITALVLLPIYYKLKINTIYGYLEQRFGYWAYKTGAGFFILSAIVAASFRLFLVSKVFHLAVFVSWDIPFWVSVLISVLLIWVYTFKGGIKAVVWTDTFQTAFMLISALLCIFLIREKLDVSIGDLNNMVWESEYSKIFFWDWRSMHFFFRTMIGGMLLSICLTGLNQNLMQKNLSCRSLKESQKNMFWFSGSLIFVNFIFLFLGALLYIYAKEKGIVLPEKTDDVFPMLALNHLGVFAGIVFILGVAAAAYSSSDSSLVSLTTTFYLVFLGYDEKDDKRKNIRVLIHLGFSLLLFFAVLIFDTIKNSNVITTLFVTAGYTYGPILGLFTVGIFTDWKINDKYVLPISIICPITTYFIKEYLEYQIEGFQAGFMMVMVNALLTIIGLLIASKFGGSNTNKIELNGS